MKNVCAKIVGRDLPPQRDIPLSVSFFPTTERSGINNN